VLDRITIGKFEYATFLGTPITIPLVFVKISTIAFPTVPAPTCPEQFLFQFL
jgi:hypothetical protein